MKGEKKSPVYAGGYIKNKNYEQTLTLYFFKSKSPKFYGRIHSWLHVKLRKLKYFLALKPLFLLGRAII